MVGGQLFGTKQTFTVRIRKEECFSRYSSRRPIAAFLFRQFDLFSARGLEPDERSCEFCPVRLGLRMLRTLPCERSASFGQSVGNDGIADAGAHKVVAARRDHYKLPSIRLESEGVGLSASRQNVLPEGLACLDIDRAD